MHRVKVELGARSYDVVVADGLRGLGAEVAGLGFDRVMLVSESRVDPLWGDATANELDSAGLVVRRIVLPAGEENKTVATWSDCVRQLLEHGADRGAVVVALGGGVLGDIAGFAAACTMRGVAVVQVPTTVLAMVDSSVGGKTAVNHAKGKNLIGAFHQPVLVWAPLEVLRTLPQRERIAGLAELVKVAWLADAPRIAWIRDNAAALVMPESEVLAAAVCAAVQMKADVVALDETEQGWRAVLNLGHTLGHALENVLGYGVILHGEAVSIGMVEEARFAASRGWCDGQLVDELIELLCLLQLPTEWPDVSAERLVHALSLDKKRRGAMLDLPVVSMPGCVRVARLPVDALVTYLNGRS
ncbi:MAG: 3-dehydroquinate synthase [Kiritimatiellia bacterium]